MDCIYHSYHFQVLGISFSPFGYHAATGSEDNIYWISYQPTQILYPKFEPQEGCYLVTSSYDMTAKVWFISNHVDCFIQLNASNLYLFYSVIYMYSTGLVRQIF